MDNVLPRTVYLLLLLLLVTSVTSSNRCSSATTCSECLGVGPECAWCKSYNVSMGGRERCHHVRDIPLKCPVAADAVNPSQYVTHVKNVSLSRPDAIVRNMVQLFPQEVRLTLRPNSPLSFDVKFRQAEDYPVDLYYLMDLSNSMKDDKRKLEILGTLLNTEMVKITRNFRLGFGSFVDKVTMPYVSTHPTNLKSPCEDCAPPYGFRNHMSLSDNATAFVKQVSDARTSGNLDNPEGTFDAMMQSMVCTEAVGWRDKARRILLVATDAGFHFAGDGKLGGIVTPNDGRCHLDRDGHYAQSLAQDYPSVSQIVAKAGEHKINVLFAVTDNEYKVYSDLSARIDGSHAGKLTQDSSNVVELVKNQYEEISSKVELKDNAPKNYIRVSYHSNCLGGKSKQTSACSELKIGTTVEFRVDVELVSCPADRKERRQSFEISPVGLNETLVVRLDMLCECDCETEAEEVRASSQCSGVGTYECGVCSCPDDRVGQFCQCDRRRAESDSDDSKCRKDNSSVICSGRGTCTCGECACFAQSSEAQRVYGQFCECDNYNCPIAGPDRLMCSGHGKCDCRHCICDPDWEGDDCHCPSERIACTAPKGEVCSGRGHCDCGRCQCDRNFGGIFCEQNLSPGARCTDLSMCVGCAVFAQEKNVSGADMQHCQSCNYTIDLVDVAVVERDNEHRCQIKDDNGCQIYFVYTQKPDKTELPVRAQKTRECPPPVNVALVSLSVIGSIVAIGVCLLLAWKVVTEVHDRREFAKFERERQMAKWGKAVNPIYKPTVTTFSNPTYGGNSSNEQTTYDDEND